MKKQHNSVEKMWQSYIESIDESIQSLDKTYEAWHFCMDEKNANELAELVRKGVKRGTTSLYYSYQLENEPLPKVGQYNIITNWAGVAQCIIKTVGVEITSFNNVTEAFAQIEGEGDGSLDYWKRVHKIAFEKELVSTEKEFSEEMLVVCEIFKVVYPKLDSEGKPNFKV
ncbi:MAG TPA: ASCH domain-containing protein [Clostridia bacterium]|nr:ASCH domain-containing protein [Clostridia bacterium]